MIYIEGRERDSLKATLAPVSTLIDHVMICSTLVEP